MRLTVFGATGGIGGHVVQQMLAAGDEVTAVVRASSPSDVNGGEVVPCGYLISRADVAHLMLAAVSDPAMAQQTVGVAY
jgi:nucleoside-diphosphate-sugar epimerase